MLVAPSIRMPPRQGPNSLFSIRMFWELPVTVIQGPFGFVIFTLLITSPFLPLRTIGGLFTSPEVVPQLICASAQSAWSDPIPSPASVTTSEIIFLPAIDKFTGFVGDRPNITPLSKNLTPSAQ